MAVQVLARVDGPFCYFAPGRLQCFPQSKCHGEEWVELALCDHAVRTCLVPVVAV
jgi:hypothetical protein